MPRIGRPENLTNRKGRPKGALNKETQIKRGYIEAFTKLGGVKALVEEAKKNPSFRRKLLLETIPSLLPKKSELDMRGEVEVRRELTAEERAIVDRLKEGLLKGVGALEHK